MEISSYRCLIMCYNPIEMSVSSKKLLKIMKGLNSAQREVVESDVGPLLVLAGPGSGKTRVITRRIAFLVEGRYVDPGNIAAMTFTNKAAREMEERLLGNPESDIEPPLLKHWREYRNRFTCGTFHSFCAKVLRQHGRHVGLEHGFSIFDEEDQIRLIKLAMADSSIDPEQYSPRSIIGRISRAKSQGIDHRKFERESEGYFEEIVARVYSRYQDLMALNNSADFDDLLFKTVDLFGTVPEVLKHYQQRYVYLLVDEFQDTDKAQYNLIKQISGGSRNICVVGDPDQSIYSWRNADIGNILSFQHDYPDAKVVTLSINYRSSGTILEAAKGVIASNNNRLEHDITTSRDQGDKIIVRCSSNDLEEARYVVEQIKAMKDKDNRKLSDFAVMYRTNAQSKAFEDACLQSTMQIPYQIIGGMRFYERKEVKDIIAYLRLISNPEDQISLARIVNTPTRGIGTRSLGRLTDWAKMKGISLYSVMEMVCENRDDSDHFAQSLSSRSLNAISRFVDLIRGFREKSLSLNAAELIDVVVDNTNYLAYLKSSESKTTDWSGVGYVWEERWDNVMELRKTAAREFRHLNPTDSLVEFLEKLALVAKVDSYDETSDKITLITLHMAKGLEFPVVFITGMEEGLLPHYRSLNIEDSRKRQEALEEERRLFYVGITRCMDRLFLTRTRDRFFRGVTIHPGPSTFLNEIPLHLTITYPTGSSLLDGVPTRYMTEDDHRLVVPDRFNVIGEDCNPNDEMEQSFHVGDRVNHPNFGEGLVMHSRRSGQDSEVTVVFGVGVGVKRLLVSMAKLDKL